jgi:hypothetical protein
MTLKDALGNEVRSRTSGTLQHCSNQQDEFMNIQPTSVTFDLTADLHQDVGSLPYYISRSKVGVTGFTVTVTRISVPGTDCRFEDGLIGFHLLDFLKIMY